MLYGQIDFVSLTNDSPESYHYQQVNWSAGVIKFKKAGDRLSTVMDLATANILDGLLLLLSGCKVRITL